MFYIDGGDDAAFFGGSDKRGFVNIETTAVNYSAGVFDNPHIALQASSQPDDNDGFVGITYATSDSDNYGWSAGAERTSSGVGDFVFTEHNNSATGSEKLRITQSGAATFSGVVTIPVGSVGAPSLTFAGDSDTGIFRRLANTIDITTGGTLRLEIDSAGNFIVQNTFYAEGGAVFNENSADVDFRVESDGNANMLFVDAANNSVNIGTSTNSGFTLNVTGSTQVQNNLVVVSTGGANLTQGDIMIKSSTSDSPSARGQGVFMFNEGADRTWYAGTGYNAGGDYHIGFANDTSSTKEGARTTNSVFSLYNSASGAVFNENSADRDFRVESNGNANMLFVDAGNDRVVVGGTTNYVGSKFAVDAGRTTLKVRSTTQGQNLLVDGYVEASDDNILVFGTQRSSGGPFLGYGTGQNGSSADWTATYDNFDGSHSVVVLNGASIEYYFDTSNSQTTVGDAIPNFVSGFKGGRSGMIFNDDSNANLDFRVETDATSNGFVVNAGSGTVCVGRDNTWAFGTNTTPGFAVNAATGRLDVSADDVARITQINDSTGIYDRFYRASSIVGSITTNGTNTAYNTSSDVRLKENIADADDAGSKIDAIQVRKYDWKADSLHQDYGMVAQELLEVAPDAVHQPEDPEEMMGVDYSKLVPMLIKEIQSLRARVADLES